jgi:Amt family ammonium transporter
VSITGDADRMMPWAAVVFGFLGVTLYFWLSKLWVKLRIDDTLDASPLHGFVGMYGCFIVGLVDIEFGGFYGFGGRALGYQCLGIITIAAWTVGLTFILLYTMKLCGILRISEDCEV